VSHWPPGAVDFDACVTKNPDLFVAWRYVAAVPRLPKNFLQAFPTYGWSNQGLRSPLGQRPSGFFVIPKPAESTHSPMRNTSAFIARAERSPRL